MKKKWEVAGFLLFSGIMLAMVVLWQAFRISSFGAEVNDHEGRVFDYAGLFRQEEAAGLEEKTAKLRETFKAEFIVLTVDKAGGQTAREIADEFYFSHGFGKSFEEDGAVVLIDMDNREIYLGTYGIMIRVITDLRLQHILDLAYPCVAEEDYAGAAMAMLTGCEEYIRQGIVAGQYNQDAETGKIEVYRTIRWYEALAAFAVSAAVAGIACLGVCRSYKQKGKAEKEGRLAYQQHSKVHVQPSSDPLLHTAVHHTVIQRQHTGGHSSGGSSARRSTTHSHGGHRAGGGGRRF